MTELIVIEIDFEIFSHFLKKFLFFVRNRMLEDLKIGDEYDGFLFLAEAARNPPVLKPHHHEELELNLVVSGEITYVVGGRRFRFPRGTLLWMFPDQEHQLVDRTGDARYYVAVFKQELLQRVCRSQAYEGLLSRTGEGDQVLGRVLDPDSYAYLKLTMDGLMRDSMDADLLNRQAGFGIQGDFTFQHGDPDALNAGLHFLAVHCWRVSCDGPDQNRAVNLHPAVVRALLVMTEDLSLSLVQVAERCGISPAHLSRVFHRQVGVPLSRYRNSARIGKFMELYHLHPDRTLLDLVLEAGFGSYPQFHKIFSQHYGQGPGEFSGRYRDQG